MSEYAKLVAQLNSAGLAYGMGRMPLEAARAIEKLSMALQEAKASELAQRVFVQEWIDGAETLRAAQVRADTAEAEVLRLRNCITAAIRRHGLKGKCTCSDCSILRDVLGVGDRV